MGSNVHLAHARVFFRALAASGVRHVVLSPGSRSTPLALAAAAEKGLEVHTIVDERSAAFFALGQARVTHEPSVLVCTSGTAAAHYLPAVIEASQSHLPLVVVTADRPWEAQDCASSQTIDQTKLFGAHVRHAAELGLPDVHAPALRAASRIGAQAAHRARFPDPGPVHVNARFRKPLEPVAVAGREAFEDEVDRLLARGAPRVHVPQTDVEDAAEAIATMCRAAECGLIVAGPAPLLGNLERARAAVAALSRATGFPVFAEATSQLRFGGSDAMPLVGAFDAFLRDPATRKRFAPDLVLQVFAPPISSSYEAWMSDHPACARIVLAPHGWDDPSSLATDLVFGDPYALARATADLLSQQRPTAPQRWAHELRSVDESARAAVVADLESRDWNEGRIAHEVVEALPEGAVLVVGNSMPVRDIDTYALPSKRGLGVLHQRGASGIDGVISGAAGARSVCDPPMALLLGDLSALHDIGALAVLRHVSRPLVVVIVQNDGGRIFEGLPLFDAKGFEEGFERHFATPQGVDFSGAAAMFSIPYVRADSIGALRGALHEGFERDGATIIEAVVPAHEGMQRRKRLWADVAARLRASKERA